MKTFKNLFVKESIQADKIDSAIATQKKRLEFAKLMAKKSEQDKKERMATKDARAYKGKTESVELDEAAKDYSAMFDALKKGDMVTIKYDSSIKKGSEGTFKVTFKSVVGKSKVGKITMTRQGDNAGKMKYYLYNRNGNVTLALGDMGASMTSLVKESVDLAERDYRKEYDNYQGRPEQIANRSSRNKARRIMAKENDVDGMDVGHADNDPLNNDPKNLRLENPSDNRREPRMRSEELVVEAMGYELYHKDFSSAMKHAYEYAKSGLGIIVDPSEIDDKVAMGPKKPSNGKTNSYRLLGKDGKKAIQVQVYNMGNSYELNMYRESFELDEASKTLEAMMKIVDQKQAAKIDGVMVDMFTASAVTQIYNKVNDTNKAKLDKMKATQLANVAMKLMQKEDVQLDEALNDLDESRAAATKAALSKQAEVSKKGKEKVTLKTAPWYKKESVELDEAPRRKGAPKIKPDFLKVQRAKDAEHNAAMGRTATGRKKPVRTMTSTQKSLASMRREGVKLEDFTIADVIAEEVFNEAFKAGGLKLDDGKQVLVKKEDAKMLNDLMTQLSGTNSKKMTATAMRDKKGFAEILGFAKETSQ